MDVSFISATLLLGPVFAAAPGLTEAVILVKPQFEAGRGNVGKGGIVRDPEAHQLAIDRSPIAFVRWDGKSSRQFHRPSPALKATGSFCSMRDGLECG